MPTMRPLLTDFSAGELSPKLAGRVDLPVYFKGAQEITNFRVNPLGGASKRPGTSFVYETLNGAVARLIPWKIDDSTIFVIELTATATPGEGRLRLFYNGSPVTDSTPATISLTTTLLASELMAVQYAQSYREIYLVHKNHAPHFLRYVSGTPTTAVFEYTSSDDSFGSNLIEWTAPTTTPYEMYDFWEKVGTWLMPRKSYPATGTFATKAVTYIERRDKSIIITLATGTFASIGTTNTSTTLTGFSSLTIDSLKGLYVSGTGIPEGAYIVSNTATEATLSAAATATGTITLTRGNLLLDKTSTYIHQGNLAIDMRPFYGTDNYPGVVCYYAGRLWLGGSVNDPSTFWGSKVNDLKNFNIYETVVYDAKEETDSGIVMFGTSDGVSATTTASGTTITGFSGLTPDALIGKYVTGLNIAYGTKVTDNDATTVTIDIGALAAGTCFLRFTDWHDAGISEYETVENETQQVGPGSAIRFKLATEEDESLCWISGHDGLQIGTGSTEWVIENAHNATQVRAIQVSRYGSSLIQARMVGGVTVYVGASSRHIRQLSADLLPPLTAQAEHMVTSGVTQIDFSQAPDVCLWAVLTNGELLRCVMDQSMGVMAWDRTELRSGDKVLSICVVPGATRDYVYIVTERTINSTTKRYIELFQENTDLTTAEGSASTSWITRMYLDCMVQKYHATAFTTVTGLAHLNDQECVYRAYLHNADASLEDWSEGTVTPSAGTATIPSSHYAIIGLGFNATLKTMRIDARETEGLNKNIGSVFFRLLRSFEFTLKWGTVTGKSAAVVLDDDAEPYTGGILVTTDAPSGTDAELTIESNSPVPCGIQSIVPVIEVSE